MNKAFSDLSLRALLLLLVGLLVVVALVFAARDLQHSRAAYRNAALLAERNQVADSCLQAVRHFAFERGRSNVVLRGKEAINEINRRFIDEHRSAADVIIAELLTRLPDASREEGVEVRQAWEVVKSLRATLEHDFARRLAERDPALPGQWLTAANNLVTRLEDLLADVSSLPGNNDAGFELLSNLRILALQFRNVVGSESGMLAAELFSGHVPGGETIGMANLLRGRSMQIWSPLEQGTRRLADGDASLALDKLRTELFSRLHPLHDEIIRAAGTHKLAPIGIEQYLAVSVSALESSDELADGISHAAAAYTNKLLEQARQQERVALASIIAILVLAGLVAMLLVWRFTRPLNEVLGRIDRLLGLQAGNSPLTRTAPGRSELARVQQALEVLEQAMQARLRSEEAFKESERMSASILACVPQSIIATDVNGLITVFSPGAENMLGYSAAEMVGKQTPLLIHDSREILSRAEELTKKLGVVVKPDFDVFSIKRRISAKPDQREWTYLRKDGTRLTVLLTTTSLRNALGEIDGYLGVATDITERTRAVARIKRMAHYDHLTRLPNRRLFHDRIQVAIAQARRENTRLALMMIDLDDFKPINDSFGHAVGDLLLKAVAKSMLGCLRESDTLARLGGDEFVVLLPGIGTDQDAMGVAEKIRLALDQPFQLAGGHQVTIACSIGVTIFPDHGNNEKHLSQNADAAMYAAKELGRNSVQLFSGVSGSVTKDAAEAGDLSIVRLVWRKAYKCGEESIDQDHQALFDQANELIHTAMSGAQEPGQLSAALDDLINSVKQHFAREEAVLARYHYAGLEEHVLQHQKLVGRALELRHMADAGEMTLGDLVTFLVQEVVAIHLLKEDARFFPLFRKALNNPPADSSIETSGH
ncbi:MAG: diguanylate cyclase [Propionivibrio sp.]|uniref:diguanylate cyclase domain-containing protein n=1 Tax=Propionivibrio sp. TaxID=2212460 RepID=UPI001A48D137|nr:diguanylate cyclase [Propionivibrio sp.]MBL8413214.1 diguanylate cyclase [Propionivibrio sp.]